MYRELARAREISHVTDKGALNLGQTGKEIKRSYELHNIEPETQYLQIADQLELFLQEHLPIIRLDSKRLLAWNLMMYLAIYYFFLSSLFAIFIAIVLDYGVVIHEPFHLVSKYSMLVCLLIDMILVRWRVQFQELSANRNHYIVSRRYFIYYFPIDFLSLVVVILEVADVQISYAKVVIYLKVFLLMEIQEQITAALDPYPLLQFLFNALRLLCFIAVCSFFFASVYVMIDLHYVQERGFFYQHGFLWLTSPPTLDYVNLYENFGWSVWFQYALFFVMQMVRGCGLGVPSPRNPLSMLWYSISNLTMSIMFWYFTDKVIRMIQKFYERRTTIENLINLKDMRQIKIISEKNYNKYTEFLKTDLTPELESLHLESKLSEMFPLTLRIELNFALKQHFLLRFSFLNSIISHTFTEELFRRDLAQIIHSKVVFQNEVLYRQNQVGPPKLYLSQNSVFIQSNQGLQYAEKLNEWSFTGIRQFFVERKSLFTVVASKNACVEYIDSEQFKSVVKFYPMVYESYCQRIDSIQIEREETEIIELRCWHCSQYHLSQDCHKVILDRPRLMSRLSLRRLNLRIDQIASPKMRKMRVEDRQFIRQARESKKVRNLKRPPLEIDQFKRRGFSYLNYNLEGIEYYSKFVEALLSHSEIFKLRRSSKNAEPEGNGKPGGKGNGKPGGKRNGWGEGKGGAEIKGNGKPGSKGRISKVPILQSQTFRFQRTYHTLQSKNNLQGQDR